jgi:hypothetical protein
LPLSFDLGVRPAAQGSLAYARVEWRWNELFSSALRGSYVTGGTTGDLSELGTDSLYALSTGDGSLTLDALALGGKLGFLGWKARAGLGFKSETMEERGVYQDMGAQTFSNLVRGWRLGLVLGGALSASFGSVSASWDLDLTPFMYYRVEQTQASSLIAPTGILTTDCLIGPEISHDLGVNVFTWFWASIHHEFLWLSVPRLVQNEAGDAWTTETLGTANQVIRILGGVSVPMPLGSVRVGLGWRRNSSAPDGGGAVSLDDGLAIELALTSGK